MLSHIYEMLWSGILFGGTCAITAFIMSPLQFLKIVKQETGKSYVDIFKNSLNKYGVSAFYRGGISYAVTNFLSSMSFGIAEYIFYLVYSDQKMFSGSMATMIYMVVIRSTMGGVIESIFSMYPELKEIARNKEHLMHSPARLASIVLPILIRNIIFWHGIIVSYVVYITYSLSYANFVALSFIVGIIFSIISLPFDVIATQSCGSKDELGTFGRFMQIKSDNHYGRIFAGNIMRLVQMGVFTIVTVFTMLLFQYIKTS